MSSNISMIKGHLEIHHDRGVIYFHCDNAEALDRMTVTALRICALPKPIPQIQERMLDITHMFGCDWGQQDASANKTV